MEKEIIISQPTDSDGFALLQCPLCKDYFRLAADDFKSDENFDTWCPGCGLISENYISESVKEHSLKIAENYFADNIDDIFKGLGKSFKKSGFQVKSNKKLKRHSIDPLTDNLDELELIKYNCCNKTAKVNPNLIITGGYCPFCGEVRDAD